MFQKGTIGYSFKENIFQMGGNKFTI